MLVEFTSLLVEYHMNRETGIRSHNLEIVSEHTNYWAIPEPMY